MDELLAVHFAGLGGLGGSFCHGGLCGGFGGGSSRSGGCRIFGRRSLGLAAALLGLRLGSIGLLPLLSGGSGLLGLLRLLGSLGGFLLGGDFILFLGAATFFGSRLGLGGFLGFDHGFLVQDGETQGGAVHFLGALDFQGFGNASELFFAHRIQF